MVDYIISLKLQRKCICRATLVLVVFFFVVTSQFQTRFFDMYSAKFVVQVHNTKTEAYLETKHVTEQRSIQTLTGI